jgi:RNA polymerase sigma-70 factor (ECF subfamily)
MTTSNDPVERSQPVDSRIVLSPDDVEQWIADARQGCGKSLGHLAERCRQYLLLVANQELDASLRGKVGASDVVQETLLTAQQIFGRFDGQTEVQLRLWLRRILLHKLAHEGRYYGRTAKRDVLREQELIFDGSRNDGLGLVDQAPTPRGNAIANEQTEAIERAIEQLPDHYQQLIRLRCFEQLTFVQIGELVDTTPDAARKMWCRAIEALGRKWAAPDESR